MVLWNCVSLLRGDKGDTLGPAFSPRHAEDTCTKAPALFPHRLDSTGPSGALFSLVTLLRLAFSTNAKHKLHPKGLILRC